MLIIFNASGALHNLQFFIQNIIAHHFVRRLIQRLMPTPNWAAEHVLEPLEAARHSQLQQLVHPFAEARPLAEELSQRSMKLRSEIGADECLCRTNGGGSSIILRRIDGRKIQAMHAISPPISSSSFKLFAQR